VLLPFALHRDTNSGVTLILLELVRFGGDYVIVNSHCTMPKQKAFNERPEVLEAFMFAEDIARFFFPSIWKKLQ